MDGLLDIKHDYGSPRWSGEFIDCTMPMTFDTYSNCSYGCAYCFSQYQRGIGASEDKYYQKKVSSVNIDRVKEIFLHPETSQFGKYILARKVMQWGGLSDQFDEFERKYGVTLELLKFFKSINYPICFSTKAVWPFFDDRYRKIFNGQDNWNVKFSIITLDDKCAKKIERGVPLPSERLKALHEYTTLNNGGATLRLRPFIIGVTSKDYEQLIVEAYNAGARAVSTEFLCVESRAKSRVRENYKIISECCGFDIMDFYKKYSYGSGYLRLNRSIKYPYIEKMQSLCKTLGMRFYVSDAHFKECCHNGCCCGLDEAWNYSRGNFCQALQICKNNGVVYWKDISEEAFFLEDVLYNRAIGFNAGSAEHMSKFVDMTMKDYLHYVWNNPLSGQSPYKLFDGIMVPDGLDNNNDVIYKYNPNKTIRM